MNLPETLGGRRRWIFLRLVLNGFGQAAAMVASAVVIQSTVDWYVVGKTALEGIPDLRLLAVALLSVGLLASWLRAHERIEAERLGQEYANRVRDRLFRQLMRLTPRSQSRRSRGDLLLRFVGDLDALRRWLSMGLARLAVAGLLTSITFVVLAVLNVRLALTVLAALLMGVLLSLVQGPPLENAVRESRRRRSYLASNISEKISAMAVVQAHGQRKRELRHLRRQSTRLKNAMIRRAARVGGLRALSEGTVRLATACALLVGAVEVGAGQASAGTVVAAMSVVAFLAAPLRDLSRVYEYWQAARVSREKLAGFLSRPDVVRDPRHPAQLRPGPGRLEFLDVSVAGSLDGFTAVVRPGQVTAVIGPNGAGKSTLVWLIARLLEPESGEILLDGQPLRSLRVDTLRRAVGLVSLDVPLLKGSVEKNLRYRGGQVSDTEFARICQLCGVDEVLADLPDGLRSRVAEGGLNLSLGQRQRIVLARALLGSPRVLLLDEPETGLDPAAQAVLDRALREYQNTVLMVTHDIDRARQADEVWRIVNGQLADCGPPSKLLGDRETTVDLLAWSRTAAKRHPDNKGVSHGS